MSVQTPFPIQGLTRGRSRSLSRGLTAPLSTVLGRSVSGNAPVVTFDGIPIGGNFVVGGTTFTANWGDHFTDVKPNVIRPSNGLARYGSVKDYTAGARGSDTVLGTMQDTDPYWTGHNDANRGVAIGYDNMRMQNGTEIVLQARRASAPEQIFFEGSGRTEVAAMLDEIFTVHWHPGAQGTDDICVRSRIKFNSGAPHGSHPTRRSFSGSPYGNPGNKTGTEMDVEGNSIDQVASIGDWTGGAFDPNRAATHLEILDDTWHILDVIMNTTRTLFYVDGTLITSSNFSANTSNKWTRGLTTQHVYAGTFSSDTYDAADWAAKPNGASITLDYIAYGVIPGNTHVKSAVANASYQVAYGAALNIPVGDATTHWGSAIADELEWVMMEENDPYGSHTSQPANLAALGLSFGGSPRAITGTPTSTKSGRMHFILSPTALVGQTSEPWHGVVDIGPHFTGAGVVVPHGSATPVDIYGLFDCGSLTSNEDGTCGKTITVSGLPSGITYNSSTHMLVPDGTQAYAITALTMSCTNCVGQSTGNVTVQLIVPQFLDSANLVGLYDFSDTTKVTTTNVSGTLWMTAMANSKAGNGDLTISGGTLNGSGGGWRNLLDTARNRHYGKLTANTSSQANLVKCEALSTDLVSTMFGGNDTPHSVIVAKIPQSTSAGFIWSASKTKDATNANVIAGLKGSGAAVSTYRRRASTSAGQTSNTWGAAGEAVGTPRTQGYRTTGTAVTVYDNNITTPVLNAAAQDQAALDTDLFFGLQPPRIEGAADPTYQLSQTDTDFYMVALFNADVGNANLANYVKEIHALNFNTILT